MLKTMSQAPRGTRDRELLLAYRRNASIKLRNCIVDRNRGLVRKVAHRLSRQCNEPLEDLEQIGYLGLIRAVERFDPQQGCAFSSFAVPYIRGEMLHFLRDRASLIRIPRRWQELYKRGQEAYQQLLRQTGNTPTDGEVATVLDISVDEWREVLLACQNLLPLSLDMVITTRQDSPNTLGDALPDYRQQQQQQWDEEHQMIRSALFQLEGKTRVLIEGVYLKGHSRKEVAECIGISPMTVTRRIKRGLQEMVTFLQTHSAPAE